MNTHESRKGDYSTPQNEHDLFLIKNFPNVPLSLMRDIWNIHNEMSEEQQKDFLEASINKNWGVYDEKYNLKEQTIKYDTYNEIVDNLNKNEKITCINEDEDLDKEVREQDEREDEEAWNKSFMYNIADDVLENLEELEYDKIEDFNKKFD